MGKYFGTDGIRGVANDTLPLETVFKVGRYVGYLYNQNTKAKIVIGKDTRLSSSMFESVLAAGIAASGADAYLLGYCSTPCLAYNAMKNDFACGVMISASHNPYKDNGIKIFGNNGLKVKDEIELPIEDFIDGKCNIEFKTGDAIGNVIDYSNGKEIYKEWLYNLYPLDLSDMNLCVDLCNGSNTYMAKDVLDKTHANVTYINDDPNGININNNCGSTHLEGLCKKVREGNYDLGFAFDGDADRVLLVNGDGNVVDGDKIMYLLSKYLKDTNRLNKDTLVTTVMSNIGLFKALDKLGINTDVTAVGDKNVAESMINNDFSIGGEQSGHIIIKKDSMFGDGLKTVLAVLEALKYYGLDIKEAIKDLKIYPQLLINEKVKDKKIVLDDEEINKLIKEISHELGDNGRILVRPSGTEPLIRVMVEAESDELCQKDVYRVIDLIKEKGY